MTIAAILMILATLIHGAYTVGATLLSYSFSIANWFELHLWAAWFAFGFLAASVLWKFLL